jgi:hypothetical protein
MRIRIQLFTSMGIRIQGALTSLKAEFLHEKDTIHDYFDPFLAGVMRNPLSPAWQGRGLA